MPLVGRPRGRGAGGAREAVEGERSRRRPRREARQGAPCPPRLMMGERGRRPRPPRPRTERDRRRTGVAGRAARAEVGGVSPAAASSMPASWLAERRRRPEAPSTNAPGEASWDASADPQVEGSSMLSRIEEGSRREVVVGGDRRSCGSSQRAFRGACAQPPTTPDRGSQTHSLKLLVDHTTTSGPSAQAQASVGTALV